jgi:hypothetical protein
MDRSYPYTRRVNQRTRLQRRVALAFAAAVAGCVVLYSALKAAPPSDPPAFTTVPARLASASSMPAAAGPEAAARRVYPYSIVPGGVSGAAELARVIRKDRVVAAHYAEFNIDKAHATTVTTPRAVHVSYRKGDQVFWTAKKVMLAEGETLLSDGRSELRARCANRISDTPQLPVEAHAPSSEELDSSVVENMTALEGSMENVSLAMLDDGGSGRGGFVRAPGSGTAPGASGGDAGSTATSPGGGTPASSAASGLGPVSQGGSVLGRSSSSTATRPTPGSATPGSPAGSPAATLPGTSGNTGGGDVSKPGTPTEPAGPATVTQPAIPGTPGSTPQPGTSLPSPGEDPATGTTPPPGATAPGVPTAPAPGTGTKPLPGNATGSTPEAGNTLPSPTQPPAGGTGATPGNALPGLPSGTSPGTGVPGVAPAPAPGAGSAPLPGTQAGGGENTGVPQQPATPPATDGGTAPVATGPGANTGEPPLTEPVATPPLQPAKPDAHTPAPTEIPEPGSLWLMGAALAAVLVPRRRQRGR